jgi:hypothetical protein
LILQALPQVQPPALTSTTAYISPQCAAAGASLHRHLRSGSPRATAAPPTGAPRPQRPTTSIGGGGGQPSARDAAPTPRALPLLGLARRVSWNGIVCFSTPELQHDASWYVSAAVQGPNAAVNPTHTGTRHCVIARHKTVDGNTNPPTHTHASRPLYPEMFLSQTHAPWQWLLRYLDTCCCFSQRTLRFELCRTPHAAGLPSSRSDLQLSKLRRSARGSFAQCCMHAGPNATAHWLAS